MALLNRRGAHGRKKPFASTSEMRNSPFALCNFAVFSYVAAMHRKRGEFPSAAAAAAASASVGGVGDGVTNRIKIMSASSSSDAFSHSWVVAVVAVARCHCPPVSVVVASSARLERRVQRPSLVGEAQTRNSHIFRKCPCS